MIYIVYASLFISTLVFYLLAEIPLSLFAAGFILGIATADLILDINR